jgi:8-oxo-dGTP pyrophosphatase MutT (NUDIX family)
MLNQIEQNGEYQMADEAVAQKRVQPRLASAIMLLRDRDAGQGIEVFMVRRVIQSDFMPDVYVFPGGSVSADDKAAEQAENVCMPVAAAVADPEGRTGLGTGVRAAAIRELFEEAGVLLAYRTGEILAINEEDVARFASYRQAFQQRKGSLVEMAHAENLMLATDHLGYFAHWITPEGMPKRFDTHFFVTTAPAEQQAAHDRLETSEGVWIAPAEALARSELGEFPLVFATIHQLHDLAAFGSVQEALASTTTQYVAPRIPILVQENGVTRVHLVGDEKNAWDVPAHMTKM